jgi:hypothetical protein
VTEELVEMVQYIKILGSLRIYKTCDYPYFQLREYQELMVYPKFLQHGLDYRVNGSHVSHTRHLEPNSHQQCLHLFLSPCITTVCAGSCICTK